MKIEAVTQIDRPIEDVWALVADDFTSIQRWSASVFTSDPIEAAEADGSAPVAGRYCTFTEDPKGFGAREVIRKYDKANHRLEFDVVPVNAPAAVPLKQNHVVLTLEALGPSTTRVRWVATPELKAHGYLMYPMVKLGLGKAFRGILKELKEFARVELPRPRDAAQGALTSLLRADAGSRLTRK